MSLDLTRTDALTQAMRLALERGMLPTAIGTAELREITERLRERIFFSARTTNAWYVEKLKALVERYVKGEGLDNDLAQLRVEARALLVQAGYTPEKGFPRDEELGIPPATPGSLKDLSSEKRLNLIFQTQSDMMSGLGKKLRGLARADRWPAWELVRVTYFNVRVPRAWLERWKTAAENVDGAGVANGSRMIALKTSPIWQALGSSALFGDALNVDHPPFAFGSGMGWREVPADEARELGLDLDALDAQQEDFLNGRDDPTPPMEDAERAAKLERYRKLKAKFDAIDAARA